jgi:hypothetical protein
MTGSGIGCALCNRCSVQNSVSAVSGGVMIESMRSGWARTAPPVKVNMATQAIAATRM